MSITSGTNEISPIYLKDVIFKNLSCQHYYWIYYYYGPLAGIMIHYFQCHDDLTMIKLL